MSLGCHYLFMVPRPGACTSGLAHDIAGRLAKRGFMLAASPPGTLLLVDSRHAGTILAAGASCLVGFLYDRAFARLSDPVVLRGVGDDPARFQADFWGGYVVVDAPPGGTPTMLRDPGGQFPCYYASCAEWVAIGSDLDMLRAARPCETTVDWGAIARHLRAPGYRVTATAVTGVSELEPGSRLVITADRVRTETIWSPWTFTAQTAQYRTRAEAVDAVRAAAIGCTAAWAGLARHVLLELSGGLDSSIVASALHAGQRRASAMTYATHERLGDERAQALQVADYLDLDLDQAFLDIDAVDIERSEARHLPRPVARAFEQAVDQLSLSAAGRAGADMFMHGGGGDNVFCFLFSTAPVLDRLDCEGRGRGVLRSLEDICTLTGCSVWQALEQLVRRWAGSPPMQWWQEDRRFLSKSCLEVEYEAHEWFAACEDQLPGKKAHVALLVRIRNSVEAFGRAHAASVVGPLLSQPLVEACLRVPSWWWCEGGRDRSVARDAFADLLPPATIARRIKGSPDAFAVRLFETRRAEIAAFLLDGALARQGLLDLDALRAALGRAGPTIGNDFLRILTLVDVEAWIRSIMAESGAAP